MRAGSHIHFGWAGGLEAGQPHCYRIQGPSFIIEYDNIQNEANHIHTVWRDFEGDFGRDWHGSIMHAPIDDDRQTGQTQFIRQ